MFAKRLRELREQMQLSQEELAIRISSSEPQIWRYEKGDAIPRADVIVRLADFFGVTADFLLGRSDDPRGNAETTAQEQRVLNAMRRGERIEAIKAIVDDDQTASSGA